MVVPQTFRVADLSPEERHTVESLLGKELADSASFQLEVLQGDIQPGGDHPPPDALARLQQARLAVAEHTKRLNDQDLDEILADRPIGVEASADRR